MAPSRPFPPSPRRRALARAAGVHAASAHVVAAVAWGAALIATVALAHAAAVALGDAIARACAGRAALDADQVVPAVLALAAPVVTAAALAAIVAHVAQTRALWLPRRKLPDAPRPEPMRGARAGVELGGAAIVGAVAAGWIWVEAPRLAALLELPPDPALAGALLASVAAAIAVTLVAIAVLDVIVRRVELARGLAMTAAEKREDDRMAGALRPRRPVDDPVAGAAVVVLGDDVAAAVAWHPTQRPVPTCTAVGRGAQATRLVALARRHRVAVHRDPELAAELRVGAVHESRWPSLAELVAAARR